jgi:hypothetical protein
MGDDRIDKVVSHMDMGYLVTLLLLLSPLTSQPLPPAMQARRLAARRR